MTTTRAQLLIVAVIAALVIVGCDSNMLAYSTRNLTPRPTTTQTAQDAQATLISARANAEQADAVSTAQAIEAQNRLSAEYINATATAQAVQLDTTQKLGAVMIEQAKANATLQARSIAATVESINRQSQLEAQTAISKTSALTAQAALDAERVERERNKESDFWWVLPDYIMHAAPCGGMVLLLFAGWYILRALASRLAGDSERAEMALRMPSISLYLPAPHSPAVEDEQIIDNTGVTGNEETPVNTGNSAVTLENTGDFMNVGRGNTSPMLRMSDEERSEFQAVRHDAIALLARCVDYYKQSNPVSVDDGTIPRYDKLKMKPEYRGTIVDNLEYSGLASKTKNRSAVVPEIGSCEVLMRLIVSNRKRVYPMGYHERKKEIERSAVMALDEA